MSLRRYTLIVVGLIGSSQAVTVLACDPATGSASLYGASLAAVNALLAHALVVWSASRSPTVFLGAVLGGMAVRLLALLALVVVGVRLLGLPPLPLVFSLLAHFATFQTLELLVLHRKTSRVSAR